MYVSCTAFTATHEAGHFIMAKHLGLSVKEFVVSRGAVFFERHIGETNFKLGLNIWSGGIVSMEPQKDRHIDMEMVSIYLTPTLLVGFAALLLFVFLRTLTGDKVTISPSMADLTKQIDNPRIRLWYSSMLTIMGFILVLPGIFFWNVFVNKRDTYKLFLIRGNRTLGFASKLLMYCLIGGLLWQVSNTWPIQWNDVSVLPLLFIANHYVIDDWALRTIDIVMSIVLPIFVALAIIRVLRRENVGFKLHPNKTVTVEIMAVGPVVVKIEE